MESARSLLPGGVSTCTPYVKTFGFTNGRSQAQQKSQYDISCLWTVLSSKILTLYVMVRIVYKILPTQLRPAASILLSIYRALPFHKISSNLLARFSTPLKADAPQMPWDVFGTVRLKHTIFSLLAVSTSLTTDGFIRSLIVFTENPTSYGRHVQRIHCIHRAHVAKEALPMGQILDPVETIHAIRQTNGRHVPNIAVEVTNVLGFIDLYRSVRLT